MYSYSVQYTHTMFLEDDKTRERILILISAVTNTTGASDGEIRYHRKHWSKYCWRYYDLDDVSKSHIHKARMSEIKNMFLNYDKKVM